MAEAQKKCPYCGELIKAEAIKCRFCGEYLQAPAGDQAPKSQEVPVDTEVVFEGKLSGLALVGPIVSTVFWLAVAVVVWLMGNSYIKAVTFRQIVAWVCVVAILVFLVRMLFIWLAWKNRKFKITNDRFENEWGVFRKRVQNIDMWRVQDLSFSQTFIDRIFGHGRIHILSSDKSTPGVTFGPIKQARIYYDQLKRIQIEADKRKGVMHIEQ